MQATLLGLSVAIILALVAALVGPHFVDWTQYRATFETEASKLVGLPVRIGGAIDVRLLPTPTLTLGQVEIGTAAQPLVRARELHVELALGSLMRGEYRASELRLTGPEVSLALARQRAARLAGRAHRVRSGAAADREGRDRGRPHRLCRRRERHARRARRVLVQGRSALAHRPGEGRGRLRLGRRALRLSRRREPRRRRRHHEGQARRSIRPIIRSRSRRTARCGWKTARRASRARSRWRGLPRCAQRGRARHGRGAVARDREGQGRARAGAVRAARISVRPGRARRSGSPARPNCASARTRASTACCRRGRSISTARSRCRQPSARLPLAALKAFIEPFAASYRPPFPVRLGIGVDAVTLAAGTLQSVRGDLKLDGDEWDIETLEFRAPGFAQVRLSGRVARAGDGVTLQGAGADRSEQSARLRRLARRPYRCGAGSVRRAARRRRADGRRAGVRGRAAQVRVRPQDDRGPHRLCGARAAPSRRASMPS